MEKYDRHGDMTAPSAKSGSESAPALPLFAAVGRDAKLPDKVAAQIRETILDRQIEPGQRLPSERELADQFDVSRTVIREAIRSLRAMGLVESIGRGNRVAQVDRAAVAETMSLFLQGRPISYEKVHEVRAMVEVEVAGLAAERATEEDIRRLEELCDLFAASTGDMEEAAELDVGFHSALADATQNELYRIILDAMQDVLLGARRSTLHIHGRIGKGATAHRRILDRVRVRDATGAREAMRRHLQDSLRAWRRIDRS
jgi:GntR family transcriptional repressor for pyruvate dehydrogenase complex